MIIYVLLITLIVLLFFIFYIFKKDIMSPPFIVCSGFIFSTICTIYNINSWGVKLHWNTYIVIISGVFIYTLTYWIISIFFSYKNIKNLSYNYDNIISSENSLEKIEVKNTMLFLFIILTLVISVLYIKQIFMISSKYGISDSWSNMMKTYRDISSYGILNEDELMPRIITWGYLFITSTGFVWIYILINNILVSKKVNLLLYVECALCFLLSLLSAGRIQLIQYVVAMVSIYYILFNRKSGWKVNIGFKIIMKIIIGICLILSLFSGLRSFVGRTSKQDPISYVTTYVGGSINLLDMFLQDKPTKSDIWGKETFYEVNKFIGRKLDKPNLIYVGHKEFRYANGVSIGNVYTAFRNYIYDFGYIGFVFLTMISSLVFSVIYNILKRKKINQGIDTLLLMYSYLVYSVFLIFYADYFFEMSLSIATLKVFIFFKITNYILLKRKV